MTITNLGVLFVLTKDPAPPLLPPTKLRGLSPRLGRRVTTITNLGVLSVLTKDPAPAPLLPPRCRDCPRDWVAE
ncbi:MAG UNVERIFIED_CONTAM: hypothetical protein LVR18_02300 [Planctomycetaceae bacterium]